MLLQLLLTSLAAVGGCGTGDKQLFFRSGVESNTFAI